MQNKDYSKYDRLPRAAGSELLTPGGACTYLQQEYGLNIRPTTLGNRLQEVSHYRNRFNDLMFSFEDLDLYGEMFQPVRVEVSSVG